MINMDRGGFAQCLDGTNCAAVFDGVSTGGKINLFAAQAFAEYVTEHLARTARQFQQGRGVIDTLAEQMFKEAVASSNNPGRRHADLNAEGGAATGMFVCIQPCKGKAYSIANGAGIGDCTTFVICCGNDDQSGESLPPEEARQLSVTGVRRGKSAKDSGGQLTMSIGVDGKVWTYSQPIDNKDILLLCTDGLTDNLYMPEASTIIPLIVSSTYFDAVPADRYASAVGLDAHLPRWVELEARIRLAAKTPAANVTPEQIVARLRSYVKWVTLDEYDLEQRYYSAQLKIVDLQAQLAKLSCSPVRRGSRGSSQSSSPPPLHPHRGVTPPPHRRRHLRHRRPQKLSKLRHRVAKK